MSRAVECDFWLLHLLRFYCFTKLLKIRPCTSCRNQKVATFVRPDQVKLVLHKVGNSAAKLAFACMSRAHFVHLLSAVF